MLTTCRDLMDRANAEYLEFLYERYRARPESVDASSAAFFSGLENGDGTMFAPKAGAEEGLAGPVKGVYALVNAYRTLGHFIADLDPLGENLTSHPLLNLSEFGLSEEDYDLRVGRGGFLGHSDGTLRDLVAKLQATYCRTIGVEYMGISDKSQRDWLQDYMESNLNRPTFAPAERQHILHHLMEAELFEQFLQLKYLGHKRFSVEGGEALLPLLDTLVETGATMGVEEVVMGMGHRGRLNVLAHTLRKPYSLILREFEGNALLSNFEGDGDVKYHLGYSNDHVTHDGSQIHVSLSPNPSHLELVDPVIQGIVRAKQEYLHDVRRKRVLPIAMHGDAAFTGQGIISETLSLSQINGYHTGGTIHVIVNNNLGFTANPSETRFTPYPTAVGKMIESPIFHVNADDPEAVVHAARMAIEYRQWFKVDVLIDLWCYRRYGHNETDDPSYTQPLIYKSIRKHPTVCQRYTQRLLEEGAITNGGVTDMRNSILGCLDAGLAESKTTERKQHFPTLGGVWKGMQRAGDDWSADTAVSTDLIRKVGDRATTVPSGFTVNSKLQRLLNTRKEMVAGERPIDWGCGEMLAFGTLLLEGVPVRIDGQDSQRGTFSHRHAVWHDAETGRKYTPLAHLAEEQPYFVIYNSMLSELAVMGFAYGISSADPRRLVVWEAQFGDFANGAQPIIDQFIVSGESKWQRMCGIVLLLPHGYEGQGPEHSSARLERYLNLSAEKNIQVAYPSTPAQLFHVLRRQMMRKFRKPLILMTPKSLLRHKGCVSELEEFTDNGFMNVIDDRAVRNKKKVRRVVLCTGKIFYDLLEAKEEAKIEDIAIVRVEQLYPFPEEELRDILGKYRNVKDVYWVQEEPENMGAWMFMAPRLRTLLPKGLEPVYRGRDEAASPATGALRMHQREQSEIVRSALDL